MGSYLVYQLDLKSFGIDATPFSRLKGSADSEFNNRSHRKITVIDGIIGYTGGINIADEYIHRKTRFGFWRDNGMKILGDATYNYLLMFASMWYMSTKEMLDIKKYKPILGNIIYLGLEETFSQSI